MRTIFVGPLGNGKVPTNGASVKNYHIVNRLKTILQEVIIVDTEVWKKKPWILLSILLTLITVRTKVKYILSLNSSSANKLIRLIQMVNPKAEIVYWVIGGSFAKRLKEGKWKIEPYRKLKNIIVEGASMKEDLNSIGLMNVMTMPNFKLLPQIDLTLSYTHSPVKFIFLSRIIPQKGCNLIIEAVKLLNEQGYKDKFEVDFYGPIETSYTTIFNKALSDISNIKYKGFLDLRDTANYRLLNNYTAMVFPTFWEGEGCPGIVIDAYIANLPVLASNWNLNKDYIYHNKTGILFEPKSVEALMRVLQECIDFPDVVTSLRRYIPNELVRFNINNVLTKDNLQYYGIVE